MANCMTLDRMVMAPTARSPPYFSREALKHTEMTLSLACMMNAAVPRATQGRISRGRMGRAAFSSRSRVFFPRRKEITHTQEMRLGQHRGQGSPPDAHVQDEDEQRVQHECWPPRR